MNKIDNHFKLYNSGGYFGISVFEISKIISNYTIAENSLGYQCSKNRELTVISRSMLSVL